MRLFHKCHSGFISESNYSISNRNQNLNPVQVDNIRLWRQPRTFSIFNLKDYLSAGSNSGISLENDRKTQIIKAAVKRFSKHGLGKTTLDEIARDLRIGKATIYHYFISKESLFYSSIEWESEQFIEEVRSIFENGTLSLRGRFNEYFTCKENIDQKYKLLYDIFLQLMGDDSFEKEKAILQSMLRKEEIILEMVLNPAYRTKQLKHIPSLPVMFVTTSWGWLFGVKLNRITNGEDQVLSRELLNTLIENVLPD